MRFLLFLAAFPVIACASLAPVPKPEVEVPSLPSISIKDGRFIRDREIRRFLGVNVYSLASRPDPHFNCGRTFSDEEVERLMAEVRGMVPDTFMPVVVYLIATLENQWGSCTGAGYRTAEWYRLGYRAADPETGISYRDYVADVVRRYSGESVILAWQLMNEAESRETKDAGPDDAFALYAFATDMTALIRSFDSARLIS